jgi:hypothetical protein
MLNKKYNSTLASTKPSTANVSKEANNILNTKQQSYLANANNIVKKN